MVDEVVEKVCAEKVSEEELLSRLDEVIEEYRDKPGSLIPVLQVTQALFGYLPASALKRIGLALGKSYSEVAGVVGFYPFFSTRPQGKYRIRVCLGTACYVMGAVKVLRAVEKELGITVGEVTEDGLFSLDVARHFGACGLAPIIMIGETTYQRVTSAKVKDILKDIRAKSSGKKRRKKK